MTRTEKSRSEMLFVKKTLLLCVAAGFLLSCSAAGPRTPDTHYDLAVTLPSQSFGSSTAIALQRVDMRGLQSGRAVVMITGDMPRQFQEVRGHYWHVAAPTLIERAFLAAMNTASTDAHFGTGKAMPDAAFRLALVVNEFAFAPQGMASISFEAVMTRRTGEIVLSESYHGTAPVAGADASDGVLALSAAAGTAFAVLAGDMTSAIQPQ